MQYTVYYISFNGNVFNILMKWYLGFFFVSKNGQLIVNGDVTFAGLKRDETLDIC